MDEKIKALAKLSHTNLLLTINVAGCVGTLAEQVLPFVPPDQPGVIALIHELEQLKSYLNDAQDSLQDVRAYFDLND